MNNTITIHTQDQYPITACAFEPENANGKLLLVNSATGVKQQTYYSFCTAFCRFGFLVITYDYRGVALSKPDQLKGFKASMRTWGNTDYKKPFTDFIEEHYPKSPKISNRSFCGRFNPRNEQRFRNFEKFCFVHSKYLFWTSFSKN